MYQPKYLENRWRVWHVILQCYDRAIAYRNKSDCQVHCDVVNAVNSNHRHELTIEDIDWVNNVIDEIEYLK